MANLPVLDLVIVYYQMHPELIAVGKQQVAIEKLGSLANVQQVKQLAAQLQPADYGDKEMQHFMVTKIPTGLIEVKWLQGELTKVDPLIHQAYPMSAKYFLRRRGLPIRTISRATALELTPQQKQTLDEIYENFLHWCDRLNIPMVKMDQIPFVQQSTS